MDDKNINDIDINDNNSIYNHLISNIEYFIELYKSDNCIDDLNLITQLQFNTLLFYLKNNIFINNTLLRDHNKTNNNSVTITNCNRYNYILLNMLCDYYIYNICNKYNKIANITGYCLLYNIDNSLIYGWAKLENASPAAFNIYKKLNMAYETGLSNGAQTGKNPVGYIAALNHYYKWSNDTNTTININTRSMDQIKDKYVIDNKTSVCDGLITDKQ